MSKSYSTYPALNLSLFEAFKNSASDRDASVSINTALSHEADPDASIATIRGLGDKVTKSMNDAIAAEGADLDNSALLSDRQFYQNLKHFIVDLGYAPLHYAVQSSLITGSFTESMSVLLANGASQGKLCAALEESHYNLKFKSVMSYSDCKVLVSNYNRDSDSHPIPGELVRAVATPLQLACVKGNAADQVKNAEEVMKLLITKGGHFDAPCANAYNVKIQYQLYNVNPYDTLESGEGKPYDTFQFLRWVVDSCADRSSEFYSNSLEAFTSLLSLPLVKQFFHKIVVGNNMAAHDVIYTSYAHDADAMREAISHNPDLEGVYDSLMGEHAGAGSGAATDHAA